jgi:hypothetical protein
VANCPFCGEEVSEDTVIYGGPCTSCFAEIPGEEAPTNPGEEVIAQQVEADRRQAGMRSLVPVALLVLLVLGLGAGAVVVMLTPEPEIVVLDFDELDDFAEPTIVANDQLIAKTESGATDAEATASGAPKPGPRPAPKPSATPVPQGEAATPRPDLDAGPAGRVASTGPSVGPSTGPTIGRRPSAEGIGLSGVGEVTAARRGDVLTDPDAIRKSVGQNMSAQIPRLKGCYDQRLKAEPNLSGRWRVKFTVTKAGRVKNAVAEGLQMKDAEFEACLARDVARWTFDRMAVDQPVQRTLRFEPE